MNARLRALLWRWLKRAGLTLIALSMLLGLTGLTYQAVATARDARRFPPPGRLVDVGGYRLHAHCTGEGSPTVILEAGWSDCWLNWYRVQPEVAKFTRVCSYDRAGMGWSDAGPYPRTSGQIVREMHALLSNAGIPGPYVLVGHSFGGFNVRLFAQEHPQDVAGLVLLDSIHEDQWARMPESMRACRRALPKKLKNGIPWCPLGAIRGFYTYPNPKLADAMQGVNRAVKSRIHEISANEAR
jgi:pimeloyl-ACP methyl ester carboxylesterase